MQQLDHWVAAILAPLAVWVLWNALDDFVLDAALALRLLLRRSLPRRAIPDEAQLAAVPERRMAIFVPLWKEYRVIRHMVEHNCANIQYSSYDFFIGAYPNDPPTLEAIQEAMRRFPNVHLATCPHPGPTSKADCLNWIYQRLLLFEEEHGVRFEMILTHDAEDLVHPEALRYINFYAQWYDMVQIPVLALPTPWHELTHGCYCDEFTEFQYRDMPARQFLGGFVPSNGVGTGFSRKALESLAAAHSNRIFEPGCLTEDYENGFRIHKLGLKQMFIPVHRKDGQFVATREYFPRTARAAIRQKSRWVTGIALQSWERHGWRESLGQVYWFWRDRKCLLGSTTTPLANLLFLYGAATWTWARAWGLHWTLPAAIHTPWLIQVCSFTLAMQAFHTAVRISFSSRVYGWKFAAAVPLRVVWGNWINFRATEAAIRRYVLARLRRQPLVWLKTEHSYPSRSVLVGNRPKLGEILTRNAYLSAAGLETALASQPAGVRLGEHLMVLGLLTEEHLYEALALQQNLPVGRPAEISIPLTRAIPAAVARKWTVLPFRVAAGELHVAGPELPTNAVTDEIRKFCKLEIRFHLVTPSEFAAMAGDYLPAQNTAAP